MTAARVLPPAPPLTLRAKTREDALKQYRRLAQNALALALLTDDRAPVIRVPTDYPGKQATAPTAGSDLAQRITDLDDARVEFHHARRAAIQAGDTRAEDALTRRIAQTEERLTQLRAQLCAIDTSTPRPAGHPTLYRVRLPAVVFEHPMGYEVASAPAHVLGVEVPGHSCITTDAGPYCVPHYRGNLSFEGHEHRGSTWPLWKPHSKRGVLCLASGASEGQAVLMASLLEPYEFTLGAILTTP